jgi:hypothetical protein
MRLPLKLKIIRMKKVLALGIISLSIASSFSQDLVNKDDHHFKNSSFYGSWGPHFSDFKGINKILSDSGYQVFDKISFGFGFGYSIRGPKSILNFQFTYFTQCNENEYDYCSHIDFNSYGISYGYDLIPNKMIDLYPSIGINRNRTDILLSYVDIPIIPATTFFYTVSNIARITRVNYSVDLGVGFDYFIAFKNRRFKILTGFKAGYFVQLTESTWYSHVDENEVSSVPKTNAGGTYVKLILGISF